MKTIQLSNQFLILFFSVLFISCGNDDDSTILIEEDNPQTILEIEREETTQILSNGEQKTWRIESAILTNDSGTIDISGDFNVVDDEFIFKADGVFINR